MTGELEYDTARRVSRSVYDPRPAWYPVKATFFQRQRRECPWSAEGPVADCVGQEGDGGRPVQVARDTALRSVVSRVCGKRDVVGMQMNGRAVVVEEVSESGVIDVPVGQQQRPDIRPPAANGRQDTVKLVAVPRQPGIDDGQPVA